MSLGVHAQTAVYAAFLQNMVPSLLAGSGVATLGHVPQQLAAVPHRCSGDSSVVDRESGVKRS